MHSSWKQKHRHWGPDSNPKEVDTLLVSDSTGPSLDPCWTLRNPGQREMLKSWDYSTWEAETGTKLKLSWTWQCYRISLPVGQPHSNEWVHTHHIYEYMVSINWTQWITFKKIWRVQSSLVDLGGVRWHVRSRVNMTKIHYSKFSND